LIEIQGSGNRRLVLLLIRFKFEEFHHRFSGLPVEEYVQLKDDGKTALVSYTRLVKHEKAKKKEIFIDEFEKDLKIADIFETIEERRYSGDMFAIQMDSFIKNAKAKGFSMGIISIVEKIKSLAEQDRLEDAIGEFKNF
jgi:hypothetical protein